MHTVTKAFALLAAHAAMTSQANGQSTRYYAREKVTAFPSSVPAAPRPSTPICGELTRGRHVPSASSSDLVTYVANPGAAKARCDASAASRPTITACYAQNGGSSGWAVYAVPNGVIRPTSNNPDNNWASSCT